MPIIDINVQTKVSQSTRARQLSSMFDVPGQQAHKLSWRIDAPWDERDWNIGLILGPSGAGKSTILTHEFGAPTEPVWGGESVIDDFGPDHKVDDIAAACSAVGFNTIPAWLRPYSVLSNGEKFRVTLARLMMDTPPDQTIVVDEFTSVVDRQVAQIGAHAVQKWVRKSGRRFVAATCHYDITDYLQPDWVIDASAKTFAWRSVQPRPSLTVDVRPVPYSTWAVFAPFHYLTADLNRTARCYCLFVNDQPAAFAGLLRRPHPKAKDIMGVSRLVTLPDWQGLGLAFVLVDALGAAYKVIGERVHTYPAHPALIRGFDKSPKWALKQKPGYENRNGAQLGPNSTVGRRSAGAVRTGDMSANWAHGGRPCAVFAYAGPAWDDREQALAMLSAAHGKDMSK